MENKNQKIIMVSYICIAILGAVTANILFETAAAAWGPVARIHAQDMFRHGVPVAVALCTLIYFLASKKVNTLSDEVVTETRKVVWPSRKDTTAMTIVACIMVVISSVIIFTMDYVSQEIVKIILSS